MKSLYQSKLDMYRAVASCCTQNIALINTVPALLTAFNAFNDIIASIGTLAQQHSQVITGISVNKGKFRRLLARQATTLASKVFAYADSIGDDELKSKVNFTLSDMLRFKDGELPAICYNILEAATANLDALAAYNVNGDTLSSFSNAIKAFEDLLSNPRNAISKRVNSNTGIQKLLKAGDRLLKNRMDKLMEHFIETEPVFFGTYMTNRLIVDPSTTSTQVKGEVINAATRKSVRGATITLVEKGITTTSNTRGNYAMKKLPIGIHTVNIIKPGFKSQTVTGVVVKQGQITRVSFELEEEKII